MATTAVHAGWRPCARSRPGAALEAARASARNAILRKRKRDTGGPSDTTTTSTTSSSSLSSSHDAGLGPATNRAKKVRTDGNAAQDRNHRRVGGCDDEPSSADEGRDVNACESASASLPSSSLSHERSAPALGPACTYLKYLTVMRAVKSLGVREKRELFKLMREGYSVGGGPPRPVDQHTFLPRLGVTVGEFSLFYVLTEKNEQK